MLRHALFLLFCLLSAQAAEPAGRLYYDQAHGEFAMGDAVAATAHTLNLEVVASAEPITADKLRGIRLLYLRAPAQEINAEERAAIVEFVRSGGRAVEGGTAFAWRLDKHGQPAEPFAAYAQIGRARIVVLAEGMVTLHLGTTEGERLSGVPNDPAHTTYWGKDSAAFMTEVLGWLVE